MDIDRPYSRVASCSADTAAVLRRARERVVPVAAGQGGRSLTLTTSRTTWGGLRLAPRCQR